MTGFARPQTHTDGSSTLEVALRGYDLIHEPLLNKGSCFTAEERSAFGLEGLLPCTPSTPAKQLQRIYNNISSIPIDFDKYIALSSLQDRNEHLYYQLLINHLEEMMPIVYTPTVGEACQRFSRVFRRGRGVWITPDHRGGIKTLLERIAEQRHVELLVVTDGESILGIGDQGAGGMAISIGKLSLYCAGAGIHPATTLPVCLDVGTNNQALLEDEFYLGWPNTRLTGNDYHSLVQEFVEAVASVFPGALLQWEDFRKDNALALLDRYRDTVPSFNDDIQGTGAVALAGVLSALRVTGEALGDQRIVIFGAGAAGLGMARQLQAALRESGLDAQAARRACAVLDSRGLLVDFRELRDDYKRELAWDAATVSHYKLQADGDFGLETIIEHVKPTILIGASGQAGAFSEAIIRRMAAHVERPVILPFSNPTTITEARPASLYQWTDGRCLVATGSPFDDVMYGGKIHRVGQGNNVFIFPGVGLGALVSHATYISDAMISAAATALADAVTDNELSQGLLYPSVARLREVSTAVTRAVVAKAIETGACPPCTEEEIEARLQSIIWEPAYVRYVPS